MTGQLWWFRVQGQQAEQVAARRVECGAYAERKTEDAGDSVTVHLDIAQRLADALRRCAAG